MAPLAQLDAAVTPTILNQFLTQDQLIFIAKYINECRMTNSKKKENTEDQTSPTASSTGDGVGFPHNDEPADTLMNNPVLCSYVLVIWVVLIVTLIALMSVYGTDGGDGTEAFMRFGPSSDLIFFGCTINQPSTYTYLLIFIALDSAIYEYSTAVIYSWQQEYVYTLEGRPLNVRPKMAYFIVLLYNTYLDISRLIWVRIALSSFDIWLVQAVISTIIQCISIQWYVSKRTPTRRVFLEDSLVSEFMLYFHQVHLSE